MGMNVLITGGSGFLGINLVRHLLGKDVGALTVLDTAGFDYPDARERVRFVRGDIRSRKPVALSMEGIDMVVHTAAALTVLQPRKSIRQKSTGPVSCWEEASRRGIGRFIHISSTAVYGIPDHHPLYEDDRLIGVGPYGEAKIAAEEVCLEYRAKGMCVSILRPKSFVGPERLGVFALFYDWAQAARLSPDRQREEPLPAARRRGSLRRHPPLLTKEPVIVNDTFNIGAAQFTTMREDYQAVLDDAGFGKKIHGFPAAPMIWTLRVLEALQLSPLYKWVYETASKDSFVSIDKAQRVLGFSPRYSNRDALIRNFTWYLENLDRFECRTGISHRTPWSQGVLRWAKCFF